MLRGQQLLIPNRRLFLKRAGLIIAAPAIIRPRRALALYSGIFSGGDPWASLDGRANAPAGTAQFPTLLNGYPTGSPPNARVRWPTLTGTQPQWMVAGVDYAVGVPSGTTLLDPATITTNSGQPIFATPASGTITIQGANAVLDSYDCGLTTATGGKSWNVVVKATNVTIQNCHFLDNSNNTFNAFISASGTATGLTVQYCELDGNRTNLSTSRQSTGSTQGTLISYDQSGFLCQYNYLHSANNDVIDSFFNLLVRWNLISDISNASQDSDGTQMDPVGSTASGPQAVFNTYYQPGTNTNLVNSGIKFDAQNTVGCTINNSVISNNTIIFASGTAVNFYSGVNTNPSNGMATNATIQENYFDPSASSGPRDKISCSNSGTHAIGGTITCNGNINMNDGSTIVNTA